MEEAFLPRVKKVREAPFPFIFRHRIKKWSLKKNSSEKPVRGQETILLVDDEEVILTVTREILENLGYLVLSASNGQEAISLFQEKI